MNIISLIPNKTIAALVTAIASIASIYLVQNQHGGYWWLPVIFNVLGVSSVHLIPETGKHNAVSQSGAQSVQPPGTDVQSKSNPGVLCHEGFQEEN